MYINSNIVTEIGECLVKDIYCFALIAETLIIGLCVLSSMKKKGRLGRCVFQYELLTFICAIEFIIFTFVPGTHITTLSKGLTMAAFDWLIILLMYYTQYYTELFNGVKAVKAFYDNLLHTGYDHACGKYMDTQHIQCDSYRVRGNSSTVCQGQLLV